VKLPDDVEVLPRSPDDIKAAVEVITRAFSGTADTEPELAFDWCLGPELAGKWDDPRRHDSLRWIFRYLAEGSGIILVARTPEGGIGGVAVLKIYHQKPVGGVCAATGALMRTGKPEKDAYALLNCPRMKAFDAAQKYLHKTYQTRANLYVLIAAVDPAAQGQGIGGKLMRAASAIADDEQVPCYLETSGERNPKIYERFGYEIVGQAEIKVDKTDVFDKALYAMIRPCGATGTPATDKDKLFTKREE
jgi:ribosomal protein S18 acetylase RimI-like enzyme